MSRLKTTAAYLCAHIDTSTMRVRGWDIYSEDHMRLTHVGDGNIFALLMTTHGDDFADALTRMREYLHSKHNRLQALVRRFGLP